MGRKVTIAGVVIGVPALIAALAALSIVLTLAGVAVNAWLSKKTVHGRVVAQVYDPRFAQEAYESFYTQCNGILALNQNIVTGKATLKALKSAGADQFQIAQAITVVAAYQNRQAAIAADYNAASGAWTRNDFKGADLPARIDPPYTSLTCGSGNYGGNALGNGS